MKEKLLKTGVLAAIVIMIGWGVVFSAQQAVSGSWEGTGRSAMEKPGGSADMKQMKPQKPAHSTKKKPDPRQIILLLGALFGVGSFSAVVLSVVYKTLATRRAAPLPVIYFGEEKARV